jgi:hypothetical protein
MEPVLAGWLEYSENSTRSLLSQCGGNRKRKTNAIECRIERLFNEVAELVKSSGRSVTKNSGSPEKSKS